MGQSIAPTTLDWIPGTFRQLRESILSLPYTYTIEVFTDVPTTSRLYWIGMYDIVYDEQVSKTWQWFFEIDYARGIG